MRTQQLAATIAADILRDRPRVTSPRCWCCDREFSPRPNVGDDNTAMFCSPHCIATYDSGFTMRPNPDPFITTWKAAAGGSPGYMPTPMRMGRHGFLINCAGCGREFDCVSGLRCCSRECERTLKDRKETAELMDAAGMDRPVKRKCEQCAGDIPNWRNGRRVSKSTRFCSPSCAQKARRLSDSPSAVLVAETAKKCPSNAGSQGD